MQLTPHLPVGALHSALSALQQEFLEAKTSGSTQGIAGTGYPRLLDIGIVCAVQGKTEALTCPLVLLEEALDSNTIDDCAEVFALMEARVDTWIGSFVPVNMCKLILLRMCNELLRR